MSNEFDYKSGLLIKDKGLDVLEAEVVGAAQTISLSLVGKQQDERWLFQSLIQSKDTCFNKVKFKGKPGESNIFRAFYYMISELARIGFYEENPKNMSEDLWRWSHNNLIALGLLQQESKVRGWMLDSERPEPALIDDGTQEVRFSFN